VDPAHTVELTGCEVMPAAVFTERVAAVEVKPPATQLDSLTLYWLLFKVAVTLFNPRLAVVAPGRDVQLTPPFVLISH
jgi:hypothetical protein